MTKLTEAKLDNQYFIALVAETVTKETEEALDVESKRENQH